MKNPARYRDASVPHESIEKANEALNAFYEEVDAARVKHRIAQVSLITQVNYADDGDEHTAYSLYHIGDALHQEAMAAYAYGVAQQLREKTIGEALSRKKKA